MERYKKNQDTPQDFAQELRGRSLGQTQRKQPINFPEIAQTPKPNNQFKQTGFQFKHYELDISTNNVKRRILKKNDELDLSMTGQGNQIRSTSQKPSLGARLQEQMNSQTPHSATGGHSSSLYHSSQTKHFKNFKESAGTNLEMSQRVGKPISRGLSTSFAGASMVKPVMTPTSVHGQFLVNPQNLELVPNMNNFENYLKKVIKSVERRKKQSYGEGSSKLNQMIEAEFNLERTQIMNNTNIVQGNQQNQITMYSNMQGSQSMLGKKSSKQNPHLYIEESLKEDSYQIQKIKSKQVSELKRNERSGLEPVSSTQRTAQIVLRSERNYSQEPKATEQVAYLLRETQKNDKLMIPLEQVNDPNSELMFREMKNPPINHAGIMVFSKNGFIKVGKEKNATSDFVSNEQFIENGVNNLLLKDLPFFKKFQSMRFFKQWRYTTRWNQYCRKRQQLANKYHFAKPIFSEKYFDILSTATTFRTLPLIDIKLNAIYGKKQQNTLEDRCADILELAKHKIDEIGKHQRNQFIKLKQEIIEDDLKYQDAVKESHVQQMIKKRNAGDELVMFTKEKRLLQIEQEQFKILKLRHQMFDDLLMKGVLLSQSLFQEVLLINKKNFKEIYMNSKNGPQFEISVCFNNQGKIDTDPTMDDYLESYNLIFNNMEKVIYNNQNLMEYLEYINTLFFKPKNLNAKIIFKQIKNVLHENKDYKENSNIIMENLKRDVERCKDYVDLFSNLQEIYDFSKEWENDKRDKQISLEMGFYKETWMQMDRYQAMIEKIPGSNTKLGTILVETLTLKKFLLELPKKVIDSIRHNVTLTMENETKTLREELSKTSEVLDQLPTSLNVYVEQVNTIKNLPKLVKSAGEGLKQNKNTMERIMQSSSLVLSKKIKAFERKYVETYLQDRGRLDDCADTLEELFKRSKAIHEIRSKVILYKEFLKLLYEDDPDGKQKIKENKLQCADDYETVADLHKHTIKFWKILLYWKKRRQMCYNTPFLQLDTIKIIRSINKVNLYFEQNISKHDFLKEKSRGITKIVIQQVKETSTIIEFLKDLRKDSLQQRHWLQIFNLMKAPHLKNSQAFTIINLREYHIQNYREEIQQIIDHANTELKYEMIYRSIKDEWEQLELKIIPYKETMDGYILVNTDTLISAIEENLTTLETISQSPYAMHVKNDIDEWIKTLKKILQNLEIWVNAQKHWISLDPIFQSDQFKDILDKDQTHEFKDLRNQFKRIMWSAFKNPKATYNLMIANRITIFEKLIKYFALIQNKVSEYLEQKRLVFPRFFFLTDSQFLEFLTQANSNQDFNDYINLLFQGASQLYINKIVDTTQQEDLQQDLEQTLEGGYKQLTSKDNANQPIILDQGNVGKSFFKNTNNDGTPKIKNNTGKLLLAEAKPKRSSLMSKNSMGSDDELDSDKSSQEENDDFLDPIKIKKQQRKSSFVKRKDDNQVNRKSNIIINQQEKQEQSMFQILGMISQNKELFLFENPVSLNDNAENWLKQVEISMQETVGKMIKYAISSFPKSALDEWILDYPQQTILTTIHLILTHEISQLLDQSNPNLIIEKDQERAFLDSLESVSHLNSSKSKIIHNHGTMRDGKGISSASHRTFTKKASKRGISNFTQNVKQQQANNQNLKVEQSKGDIIQNQATSKLKNQDDDEDQILKDYMKKKNELRAQQKAEEDEERKRLEEEMKQKHEQNEMPKDPKKEKRKFIDQIFGKDFPSTSQLLFYMDESGLQSQSLNVQAQKSSLIQEQLATRVLDFKDNITNLLSKRSFQGLLLRIQFWINQIISKNSQANDEETILLDQHSVHKMVMRSLVLFLLFQRDIVLLLKEKDIQDINDFEWQSQMRLLWTGENLRHDQGCKVECGGWSTYQRNEYLGSQSRLLMNPLTNRYFVFISSSLRENSAVLFRCIHNHLQAEEVFQEFSNICSMPFRKLLCSPDSQMKYMMSYLNGAALANVFIFFQHIDRLGYRLLSALNREIQMVQQQFIIEELRIHQIKNFNEQNQHNLSLSEYGNSQKGQRISNSKNKLNISSKERPSLNIKQKNKNDNSTHVSSQNLIENLSRPCFGVFASLSHQFQINHQDVSQSLIKDLQATFRILELAKPNKNLLIQMQLKSFGFISYERISNYLLQLSEAFQQITKEIFKDLLSQNQNELQKMNQIPQELNSKDLITLVKISSMLRDSEFSSIVKQFNFQEKKSAKRQYMCEFKSREQKVEEYQENEKRHEELEKQRIEIEISSIKEIIRLIYKQKYFLSWINNFQIKIDLHNKKEQDLLKHQQINQLDIERSLDFIINEAMEKAFSVILVQEEQIEEQQTQVIKGVQLSKLSINGQNQIAGISQLEGQKILTTKQEHNIEKMLQEKNFVEIITKSLRDIVGEMKLDKGNSQMRCCLEVIDYLRKFKGIAIVGPTCSGKTSILKIISMTLYRAFKINMRTSIINPLSHSINELYGHTNAFVSYQSQSQSTQHQMNLENQLQNAVVQNNVQTITQQEQFRLALTDRQSYNKQNIFQLILDMYQSEKDILTNKERNLLIQSIFFDSCQIDHSLSESMLGFLSRANKRENENYNFYDYLIQLSEQQVISNEVTEFIPVILPNSNQIMMPSDLYLFFEAESLKDSSPHFISQVGLILTQDDDLQWQSLYNRLIKIYYSKHQAFFDKFNLDGKQFIDDCYKEFLEPFIDKLTKNNRIQSWTFLQVKQCTIQFFNLFNALTYKLTDQAQLKQDDEDPYDFPLQECQRDVIWSSILSSVIWSFGAILSRDLRKLFEEIFVKDFKRKFNITLASTGIGASNLARQRFNMFDIYYDPERLQWDMLSEKLDYKLKLQYDPLNNILLIPTLEISQAYYLVDTILGLMRYDDQLDKHIRILGPSATSKSIIMNTFMKRNNDIFNSLTVPMSSYLSMNSLKQAIEKFYIPKRRNFLELQDKTKRLVIIIDDLHLQSNLKNINILEFLRTWSISKGYYDLSIGLFKNVGEFATLMGQNSEYRGDQYCKVPGRDQLKSRFLYYSNTIYQDEFEPERYKTFIQHWLTSKMWNTSKLINKYYILIANSMMSLLDKIKRHEAFNNSSLLKLTNFHIFSRFCQNIANYTLISDDVKEITSPGLREEDAIADMMAYEIQRSMGDRIMIPSLRKQFLGKLADCCKTEFLCSNNMTEIYLDSLLLGNYHEKVQGAHIKYLSNTKKMKEVRNEIREKLKRCSNNHFLESFLDAPNGLKEVFRLSRIFYKEMQHLILVGPPGCGNIEYLQLSCILNDALLFELNVARQGEPLQFSNNFKAACLSSVSLNQLSIVLINDQQLRDPTYIDFIANFLQNVTNQENIILYDEKFRKQLIQIELEIYNSNPQNRTRNPNYDLLFIQAQRKIQKNLHIVIVINELQNYYDWITLFPALEAKCEVIYMEELHKEGYRLWSQEFFEQRDTENNVLSDQKLSRALVETRQIVKNKIVTLFYSFKSLQYAVNDEFINNQLGEFVFKVDEKQNKFLFKDGNFNVTELDFKQINFNVPVEVHYTYKSRYVMFIELFRFLYDFLSLNLVIRKNYYETFLRKVAEFSEFFKDIKEAKTTLHSDQKQITFRLQQLKEQMKKVEGLISEKEQSIKRRQKDIADLEIELKNNKEELNQVIREKDYQINETLEHFEKINGSEFTYIVSTILLSPQEQAILDLLAAIIDKDNRKQGYTRHEFLIYFMNREELINVLNDRRNFEFNDQFLSRLKQFVNDYNSNDFKEKQLFKQIYNYIMELYRKLNVRNTMSGTYQRIKEITDQMVSFAFSINFSKQFIADKMQEIDQLKQKQKKIMTNEQNLSQRIEEAEISHMRTEQVFEQITSYAMKIHLKLLDIKARLSTIQGDCIILSSSVTYLGVFSFRERMNMRKEIAEYIESMQQIKSSPFWIEQNNVIKHFKLFKDVLKEYGLKRVLLSHQFSRCLSKPTLLETLFVMIFSPSCPVIIDPTGAIQDYLFSTLLTNLKIRKLYASDGGTGGSIGSINAKIEQILRSSSFATLNDLNDCSRQNYGLCQEEPMLQRLSHYLHNGFDFDYEKVSKLKQLNTLTSFFNSFTGVNKRIPTNLPEFENLSFYQIQIFSPRFDFTLGKDYQNRTTIITAIDNDIDVIAGKSFDEKYSSKQTRVLDQGNFQFNNELGQGWIEIKEIFLKHLLPEEHVKLIRIKNDIRMFDIKKSELNKNFENTFLVANQETLQSINEYSDLKHSVIAIKNAQEEKQSLRKEYNEMIYDQHSLLSQYANTFLMIFMTLKKLSKFQSEITYSWKQFTMIIDQIFFKIVKDLNDQSSKLRQAKTNLDKDGQLKQSIISEHKIHESDKLHHYNFELDSNQEQRFAQTPPLSKEFNEITIDDNFLKNTVLSTFHSVITSSMKQELISLYNLILALNFSLNRGLMSQIEYEYLLKQLVALKDFHKWREASESEFIDIESKNDKIQYYSIKKDLLKIYPEFARKFFEILEKEIGQIYVYKKASLLINGKIFGQYKEFQSMSLIQKINFSFLCPDHEFKSRLCQFMYEQLSQLFTFSEDLCKLHKFLKVASWNQPIALFSQNKINMVNTISSIASYYNVGLEVLRTDPPTDIENTMRKMQSGIENKEIIQNLNDYNTEENNIESYDLLNLQSSNFLSSKDHLNKGQKGLIYGSNSIIHSRTIWHKKKGREWLNMEEKLKLMGKGINLNGNDQSQDPLKSIEQSAINGNWVFISTQKFPSYWQKMCLLLDALRHKGKISQQFRIFIDLQGYMQNEIPDSFIFDHSISFYLTDKNVEQMNVYKDVWQMILDEKVLIELTQYTKPSDLKEQQQEEEIVIPLKLPLLDLSHEKKFIHQENQMKILEQTLNNTQQKQLYEEYVRNNKDEAKYTGQQLFGSDMTEDMNKIYQRTFTNDSPYSSPKVKQPQKRLDPFTLIKQQNSILNSSGSSLYLNKAVNQEFSMSNMMKEELKNNNFEKKTDEQFYQVGDQIEKEYGTLQKIEQNQDDEEELLRKSDLNFAQKAQFNQEYQNGVDRLIINEQQQIISEQDQQQMISSPEEQSQNKQERERERECF